MFASFSKHCCEKVPCLNLALTKYAQDRAAQLFLKKEVKEKCQEDLMISVAIS